MSKIKEMLIKKKIVIKVYLFIKFKIIHNIAWLIFTRIKINDKKIVIDNFNGKGYSDNPKYIVERIFKENLDYKIVWLILNESYTENIPENIKVVKWGTVKAIYEMATSKLWIDNVRKMYKTKKRKQQLYIQTWHGAHAFKKAEKDVEETLSEKYVKYAKKDSENADVFISNGKKMTELYRNSFWYNGYILESGFPRNDILFENNNDTIEKVKKFFKIDINTRIFLYAPTFRNSGKVDMYNLDLTMCIKEFEKKFGGKWVGLIRLHPNISNMSNRLLINNESIYNATHYDDMQELLVASDILITDYSSSPLDYMFTRHPCFLFTPDINEFVKERTFYINVEDTCFKNAKSNEELETIIRDFDYDFYIKEVDKFINEQNMIENGTASETVVRWIKEYMK